MAAGEAEARARELLERFGLAGRAGEYPDRLSGGQQHRVAIARALATEPRALLLDEVTSALDPELVGEVLEMVRDLKAAGMTTLIATHEMGFAREVADQVCFLHDGRVVERAAPERMFTAPEHPETQRFLRRLLDARRLWCPAVARVTRGLHLASKCVILRLHIELPRRHPMVPDRIERETLIDAPIERVWALITEAEHLGRWFGDAGAEIDLRSGGAMVVRWAEHGASRGRVVAVEPHTRFSYRWAPFKDPGGEEPVDGNSTLVEFTLVPEGDGTRLRVVESGFASLATSEEQRAENAEGNARGWEHETDELRAYAEKVAI